MSWFFTDCENTYDVALSRLSVHKTNYWRGISPSTYGVDFNPEPPLFAAKFSDSENYKHILAIANEDGKIALQDTNMPNEDPGGPISLEGEQCHFNAVFDLEWMPKNMKIVSASGSL